jgi:hypothetical protein
MISRLIAIAIAVPLMSVSAVGQDKADGGNAHHYQGGPQTVVPHGSKHPTNTTAAAKAKPGGSHHYSGGPRTDPHHTGEKK